jgi:hypothetical protein
MKRYKFCSKGKDEAISYVNTSSTEDATVYFSELKKLSREDFQKIYDVKEVPEIQVKK